MSFFEHSSDTMPKDPRTWAFWRCAIVLFCSMSVIGHTLIEWPYCALGATFFNTVSWTDEVLANPLKPFLVYGVGILLCYVLLIPLRDALLKRFPKKWQALLAFYIIGVFLGMAGELIQGFLQNQPVDGVYPLWDVHDYPGNILGQAWIVNDILLGALITIATWHIVPKCLNQLSKMDEKQSNYNVVIVAVGFTALMLVTYL